MGDRRSRARGSAKVVERRAVVIPINDFTLIDQSSRPFKFSELTGRVVVVTFAYTTCPDVCPLITAALRKYKAAWLPMNAGKFFYLPLPPIPKSTHRRFSPVTRKGTVRIHPIGHFLAEIKPPWKKSGKISVSV
jgi:hypothetical protein